jgi:hypothetical protein
MTIAIGVNDPGAVTGNTRGGLTLRKSPQLEVTSGLRRCCPPTPNRARRFTARVREVGFRAAEGVPIIVDGSVLGFAGVAQSDQRSAGPVGQDTIELAARLDTELGENLA